MEHPSNVEEQLSTTDIACDNLMQRMQQGCVSKNCFLVCPCLHETALPSTIEVKLWQQKLLKISGHNGPQESLKDDTRYPRVSRWALST